MSEESKRVWVIRAGRNSIAHSLFVEENLIALRSLNLPDLSKAPTEPTQFVSQIKNILLKASPLEDPRSIGRVTANAYRFIHMMKPLDLVVYPSTKIDLSLHIGRVQGPYSHATLSVDYPHQRPVSWIAVVSRSEVRSEVLKEVDAYYPFFEVKRHPRWFLKNYP